MAAIFVSYKTEDRPRVAHLVAALRAAGLDIWWDQDIPPGGGWRETIAAQLDAAALCVVAWSDQSAGPGGRFVCEEAERAARRGAYLGVLIDPVEPPFGFAEWQSVDLAQWNGKAGDPLLDHFVAQVRARLESRPIEASPAAVRRRRLPARTLALGLGLLLLAAAAFLVYRLMPGQSAPPPPPSPTAFVNAKLGGTACSWLQISSVAPAPGGERIALSGVAIAPRAVQAGLMRAALEAGVPIAEIAVDDVATGPGETCAQLELLRQYRWAGRPRLTVIPQRGPLVHTEDGWRGRLEFEIDYRDMPRHAALLGLDSDGLHALSGDLEAYRRDQVRLRTNGTVAAYESFFFDENRNARNVGLILMTSSAPIDLALVSQIGRSGDRASLTRLTRAAAAQSWQFELGLVRCGFESGQGRRC
ncbi:MAG TPA: toll/interleukin-1 receptor domain-containing protein [Allosphingosinicella sp.]|nr:toll/interleukin-1 receptor domain-containing protein [Allosphingosinicella sp.]